MPSRAAVRRAAAIGLGLWLGSAAAAAPSAAQRARLEVALPSRAPAVGEGPLVSAPGVLRERELRDLVNNGFPARLRFRVELWSDEGLFNGQEGATEWFVIVRYDALDRLYDVARVAAGRVTPLGRFEQLDEAARVAEQQQQIGLAPARRGRRYYYNAVLEIETLSMSDLDEVERWLKGELRPAVTGRRNPGTVLTRGIRTIFVRLLGGEVRRFESQSARFRAS